MMTPSPAFHTAARPRTYSNDRRGLAWVSSARPARMVLPVNQLTTRDICCKGIQQVYSVGRCYFATNRCDPATKFKGGLGDSYGTSLYTIPEYEGTRLHYRQTVRTLNDVVIAFFHIVPSSSS